MNDLGISCEWLMNELGTSCEWLMDELGMSFEWLINELAKHELRMRWAWTLSDNTLSSCLTKYSSKSSVSSGDKLEMSCKWS